MLFMGNFKPPIVETERLLLRLLTPDIYNAVFQSYTNEALMHFFGFYSNEELIIEKQKYAAGWTTHKIAFRMFHLIEKATGNVIGLCGFHTWYTHHFRAEIGYHLNDESKKGKGFMKEAIAPIIKYGFDEMHLNRIEALVGTDNVPSLKLLKGFGQPNSGILPFGDFNKKAFFISLTERVRLGDQENNDQRKLNLFKEIYQ
ncbi:N-acetyltransferase [bacterium]|nr:MAG: N-acetyltransferase [bacterium]